MFEMERAIEGTFGQRTLTIRGIITVRLDCFGSVALLHTNINIFSCLIESNQVKLETSYMYSDSSCFTKISDRNSKSTRKRGR